MIGAEQGSGPVRTVGAGRRAAGQGPGVDVIADAACSTPVARPRTCSPTPPRWCWSHGHDGRRGPPTGAGRRGVRRGPGPGRARHRVGVTAVADHNTSQRDRPGVPGAGPGRAGAGSAAWPGSRRVPVRCPASGAAGWTALAVRTARQIAGQLAAQLPAPAGPAACRAPLPAAPMPPQPAAAPEGPGPRRRPDRAPPAHAAAAPPPVDPAPPPSHLTLPPSLPPHPPPLRSLSSSPVPRRRPSLRRWPFLRHRLMRRPASLAPPPSPPSPPPPSPLSLPPPPLPTPSSPPACRRAWAPGRAAGPFGTVGPKKTPRNSAPRLFIPPRLPIPRRQPFLRHRSFPRSPRRSVPRLEPTAPLRLRPPTFPSLSRRCSGSGPGPGGRRWPAMPARWPPSRLGAHGPGGGPRAREPPAACGWPAPGSEAPPASPPPASPRPRCPRDRARARRRARRAGLIPAAPIHSLTITPR